MNESIEPLAVEMEPPTIEMESRPRPARAAKGIYPDPKTTLGKAWAVAWRELFTAQDFLDGTELAELSAGAAGLSPDTMLGLFSRMAKAGLLVKDKRIVVGTRGPRPRTFYRVPRP